MQLHSGLKRRQLRGLRDPALLAGLEARAIASAKEDAAWARVGKAILQDAEVTFAPCPCEVATRRLIRDLALVDCGLGGGRQRR
jgi:hypothetical protein